MNLLSEWFIFTAILLHKKRSLRKKWWQERRSYMNRTLHSSWRRFFYKQFYQSMPLAVRSSAQFWLQYMICVHKYSLYITPYKSTLYSVHTYIHTYIQSYIQVICIAYLHACIILHACHAPMYKHTEYIHVCTQNTHVHIYINTYTYRHAYTYIYIHCVTDIHAYVHRCIHILTCRPTYIYIIIYEHSHIYNIYTLYTHMIKHTYMQSLQCTYKHTYTHIHVYMRKYKHDTHRCIHRSTVHTYMIQYYIY